MSSRFLDRNCRDHVGFHFQVSNFFLKPPIDTMAHLYTVELTIMKGLHVVIPRCQRDTWEVWTVGCRLTPAHQQCLITHWILRKGRHRQWAFDYTMAMTLTIVILENSPYYCTALRESPQAQTSYICQAIKSVPFYTLKVIAIGSCSYQSPITYKLEYNNIIQCLLLNRCSVSFVNKRC